MQLALSGPITQHFQFRDPLALRGAWRSSYCSLASLKGILRPPTTFWNPLELGGSLWSCVTCSESCFGGSYPGILLPPPLLPSQEQKEMVWFSLEDWKLCADWTSPFPEAGWARKQVAESGVVRGGGDSLPEFLQVPSTGVSVWSCILIQSEQVGLRGGAQGSLLEVRALPGLLGKWDCDFHLDHEQTS